MLGFRTGAELLFPPMISELTQPLGPSGLYTYVFQPYFEGAERLNRAWPGIDIHSLCRTKISLKERAISFLTGFALTFFPFINAIIWLAWQVFGNPEILSDPFFPGALPQIARQTSPSPQPLPPIVLASVKAVDPTVAPPTVQQLCYIETARSVPVEMDWKIEAFPDQIRVRKNCSENEVLSRYCPNWMLQEFNHREKHKNEELHIRLVDGNRLTVRGVKEKTVTEKTHLLEHNHPWVQQMTLGFKNFVLSKAQVLHFYIVLPLNLCLVHATAKKIGLEEVPGFGKLLKIEAAPTSKLHFFLPKGQLWFDPKTGLLKKEIDAGPFTPKTVTTFVQNNRSPESEHR